MVLGVVFLLGYFFSNVSAQSIYVYLGLGITLGASNFSGKLHVSLFTLGLFGGYALFLYAVTNPSIDKNVPFPLNAIFCLLGIIVSLLLAGKEKRRIQNIEY